MPEFDRLASERLSQISTLWTELARAHGEDDGDAWAALIRLYQGAVYRYLLRAAGDPNQADELFQEFALKFLRGDYRRADPDRGRFRDFVKTSLFRLVARHRQVRRRELGLPIGDGGVPEPAAPDAPPAVGDDEAFVQSWRADLLERAWQELRAREEAGGPPFYTALRRRAERPEGSSSELAAELTASLGRPVNAASVRQTIHRAREIFADHLRGEVARSLDTPTPDAVEAELIELGLHAYCRTSPGRGRP